MKKIIYATIWGEEKISLPTELPILYSYPYSINLPKHVVKSTLFDALSHARCVISCYRSILGQ